MLKGQCMPRFKSNSCSTKNKSPTPMTLLERFREAVLRLMMYSALSKATTTTTRHGGAGDVVGSERQRRYSPYEPHHSEAVADCIEFIKKKAATDGDGNRHSSASSSADDTAESS
ncbi:hypothetical protein TanjilG_22034 [Lupinus angustifolius]|uniref:Uncharacterized protein n=1 Tax=Lupinus angustifolius TaxID=3871 RepID=A0A4P1QTQ1_LUPAN|nr:hypothetical protein TanjilG_22034 [Lupinus angustifolius]